jgi:Uma2 family endonuclease
MIRSVSATLTTDQSAAERRLTVDGVTWESYVSLCDDIVRGATRITYDQGRMEIVTVSHYHERVKTVLARLIEAYSDASGIVVEGLGSTTFRRKELLRGLEPDACYYIANASIIFGLEELDLSIHPAPDLAIEVDISPPDVSKQPIYAALSVPEIWRFTPSRGIEFLLRDGTEYVRTASSPNFPHWAAAEINELIEFGLARGQSAAAAELRRRLGAG